MFQIMINAVAVKMTIDLEHYSKKGWVIINNAVPNDYLQIVKEEGLRLRKKQSKTSHPIVTCASKQSRKLWDAYTSAFMYEIAYRILGEQIWLFNDQVVYKLPNDKMEFAPHYDNQFGNENKEKQIHTINCSWILDDFTIDNGAFSVLNKDTKEWETILPKQKDILIINGNTTHSSKPNESNKERGLYACVYSESPITLDGFYKERFLND